MDKNKITYVQLTRNATVAGCLLIPIVIIFAGSLAFFDHKDIAKATTEPVDSVTNDTMATVTSAANVYKTREMALGANVQYLVILLPNEAHESPDLPEEQRLIGEPYLPQSTVVTPETSVVWFNADVDHDHKIILTRDDQIVFEGNEFAFNDMYGPIRLNETGVYSYYETDVIDDDPDFVMKGNITVIDDDGSVTSTNGISSDQKIVGTFMVPAQDLQQYASELQNRGLDIDSSYTFKDLRGGQEGTGDEQTLLVWTSNTNEVGLDQVIQALQVVTGTLPYG
jgi:hypothetical protein